jgi:hypothetical protein
MCGQLHRSHLTRLRHLRMVCLLRLTSSSLLERALHQLHLV